MRKKTFLKIIELQTEQAEKHLNEVRSIHKEMRGFKHDFHHHLQTAGSGRQIMFRLWGKIWKDNRLLRDTVICDDSQDTRTHKIFRGLESVCYEMDLGNPIWLDSTVKDFQKHDKARFYQDNFIEQIDFDYLEIQVIEEDGQ